MNIDLFSVINTKIAVELPLYFDRTYPDVLKQAWGADSCEKALEKAFKSNADYVCVKFNVNAGMEETMAKQAKSPDKADSDLQIIPFSAELEKTAAFIEKHLKNAPKPLILRGANDMAADAMLVPFLAKHAPNECIIAFADEFTYERIVPECVKRGHRLVLRSPIDINIAKELNILAMSKGIDEDKILIDPDTGGLGYGLEYGYSIIEKIKQVAKDEEMLDKPVIAFIGEEIYKAKEAKSDMFNHEWGDCTRRAQSWEIAGATAMLCAGADTVVVWNPETVSALKGVL